MNKTKSTFSHVSYEVKHLANGRVHHVIATVVLYQGINDRGKKVSFNNVPVVEFVFERDDFAHES